MRPEVTAFFDEATNTISYVVKDPSTNACAVVDSVLDYRSRRRAHRQALGRRDHRLRAPASARGRVAARDPRPRRPPVGRALHPAEARRQARHRRRRSPMVQKIFGKIFNDGTEFQRDGSQFDRLFEDGDTYTIGEMTASPSTRPATRPACMTHVIGDAAFVGDTLFMPDGGSARADFPGGDAARSTARSRRCSRCPTRCGSSCATTTAPRPRHPVGDHGRRGKGAQHPCATKAAPRRSSWRCARPATPPSTCRS